MAGHKGYGFGLWCEILSAILPGGHATWQVGSWMFDDASRPSWHNASFVVLDIAAMAAPGEFEARLRKLIDEIHAAPTAQGVERILLPGEREWALHRIAQREGIDLPADVRNRLCTIVPETGARPEWLKP
jgi:ureidoglycolate dehydrogenase (NAD+)